MKLLGTLLALLIFGIRPARAFAPTVSTERRTATTRLEASRREILGTLGLWVVAPGLATAFSQQLDDNAFEPAQQPTGGKLDLNSAFVVRSHARCKDQ